MARQQLFDLIDEAVQARVFPGAVALVWKAGATVYHEAHGCLASEPRHPGCGQDTERETVFDLASLSKVVSTTTLIAQLVEEKKLRLEDRLPQKWWSGAHPPTLQQLLEHASGLPAHREFFAPLRATDPASVYRALESERPEYEADTRAVYSDLGFMFLGRWLEELLAAPLDQIFVERVAARLGHAAPPSRCELSSLAFRRVGPSWLGGQGERELAPTEVYDRGDPERSWLPIRQAIDPGVSWAHGRVHDDNALALDGVAGHAGLFGRAEAHLDWALAWLEARPPAPKKSIRDQFWTASRVAGSTRRLGFDGVSEGGSTGGALSPRTIGHLGYTGCSLWIDPEDPAIYIFLSNAVHPDRPDARRFLEQEERPSIRDFRPRFHQVASKL